MVTLAITCLFFAAEAKEADVLHIVELNFYHFGTLFHVATCSLILHAPSLFCSMHIFIHVSLLPRYYEKVNK